MSQPTQNDYDTERDLIALIKRGPCSITMGYRTDTDQSPIAEELAAARREGVLIGVRAGIEAARELFVFRGLPQDGPPCIYEHEAREMVEALDAQAIAERACKGGSGE